ncbi:hypothetical protein SSX86_009189 [Deinandra increscens subsp. villosa]|uniref:Uncharacterized protein n=1 Tax=Deinandra increscens subsp. villosa TaxID=3103831 RepID=A0AAP0DD90_9ASTR
MSVLGKTVTFILLIFCLLTAPSTAAIKSIKIRSDNRPLILFEKFGFTNSGNLSIAISNLSVISADSLFDPDPSFIGFFLLSDEKQIQFLFEIQQSPGLCVLDSMFVTLLFTFQNVSELHSLFHRSYNVTHPNEYSLFFANCNPLSSANLTMDVRVEAYNIYDGTTKDYLSVGLTELPSLYFIFSLIYINFLAIWIRVGFKNRRSVHRIHLLMGALLTMQAVSMFCNAEERHHVKATGTPQGWDVTFYVFRFMNSVLLFIVIVLIGAGWWYLKPFLQKKENIFLMIMIPFQVLSDVASIVMDETGPSSKDWVAWNQVYTVNDVICCCVVMLPIFWSIRSLKEPSKTDEKAGRSLSLFVQFYRLVTGYLLFTRIGVFGLETIVGYKSQWVCSAAVEIGTFVFYLVMFFMFRPIEEDGY